MTAGRHELTVVVNEALALDAGSWEEVRPEGGEPCRRIEPPTRTLFDQVLDHLASLEPPPEGPASGPVDEAVATAAVCFRWGSYLAVLMDALEPIPREARGADVSRIADSEMARIQIEASAALERWIEIRRAEPGRYRELVRRARSLPMAHERVRVDESLPLGALADAETARRLVDAVGDRWPDRRGEAEAAPTRVLANAIVNACWRNSSVENLHAGRASAYPLGQRRIVAAEEHELMTTLVGRLAHACRAVAALLGERSGRSWAERVLPFHYAPFWLVSPTGWSLDERTRLVWLPGAEPATP